MKYLLIAAAALFAAACQPMPADGGRTDLAEASPVFISTTRAPDCAARGGKMLPQGRMQTLQCVVTFADAGRRCTDGDDCAGNCRIEELVNTPSAGAPAVGQCQANSSNFGCYTTVEDGKAEATICVD